MKIPKFIQNEIDTWKKIKETKALQKTILSLKIAWKYRTLEMIWITLTWLTITLTIGSIIIIADQDLKTCTITKNTDQKNQYTYNILYTDYIRNPLPHYTNQPNTKTTITCHYTPLKNILQRQQDAKNYKKTIKEYTQNQTKKIPTI